MMADFTEDDAKKVAAVLGVKKIILEKDHFRLKIDNVADKRVLILEIYPKELLGRVRGTLIVVYTGNSHLQIHNCSGYVISEELG